MLVLWLADNDTQDWSAGIKFADLPSLPIKRKIFRFSCFSRKPSAFRLYFENLSLFIAVKK